MKRFSFKKKTIMVMLLALIMVASLLFGAPAKTAQAGAGDAPAHTKKVTKNDDGTYKIELTVTGDANTKVETAANVNVLIVYDTSSSMTSNNVTTGPNRNRADYAEDIVHDFIEGLRQYQKADDPSTTDVDESSNIQVAVVTFGPTATGRQGWTSDLTGGTNGANRFFDDGVDGDVTGSNNYGSNNGTNWEAALKQAQTYLTALDNAGDKDPTFVILVTDGACTASGNGNNAINPAGNHQWTDFQPFYNEARDEALAIESRTETTLFGIYAYGTEADLLDDLIYYAQNGSDRSGMNGGTVTDTPNYFNANNTEALTAAIKSIFQTIVNALGVSQVAISDGTTSDVSVGSGEVADLVQVIDGSYEYWLSVPVDTNNQFKRIDFDSGKEITYTVTGNNGTCTVTWTAPDGTSKSVSLEGSVDLGQFKYKWTKADDLYDKAPPAAKLNGSSVDWTFPKDFGALLDGVTYSVTFDVCPTQTTLDYIADIENNPGEDGAWKDLPGDVKKYIHSDGSFDTNTEASISWVDTRLDDQTPKTDDFDPVKPVSAEAVEQLAVSKKWENELDSQGATEVVLTVKRDEESPYTVTLNSGNSWAGKVFISIGIMRSNSAVEGGWEILAPGHDFTFVEPKNLTYHWEIDVPVVRPMQINGVVTMLIKVDTKHPVPDGATTYTINGAQYYVGSTGEAKLTATNYRRSSLVLLKEVTGEGAPADAKFPFTLNVKNALAPSTEPTDDPKHESDYWVWVSVWDENGNDVTEGVTGATYSSGSWWYAPSGEDITIQAKAGYSIRVNNLPTGTTYTITEGTLESGFGFVSSELKLYTVKKVEGSTESQEVEVTDETDSTFKGDRKTTGTIESTNRIYKVTYTNEYSVRDVTVTKVWDDASNQDGKRPETLELTLSGVTNPPTPAVTKSEDGNTWTYTWTGVPVKDAGGQTINYSITESNVPAGYSCETTTVGPGGTITNSYTPEKIAVTVTKKWDDASNQDGKRPESLTLTLKADGTEVTDVTPTVAKDGDTWTYTWTGVPKYSKGTEIKYTVTEGTVPTDYTCATATVDAGGTITNTHTPEKIDVKVTKKWDDMSDNDGKRPASLTLTLKGDDKAVDGVTPDITKDGDTWTYTWKGVPKYSAGKEIKYTVTEETVPADYICETKTVDAGGTITNVHKPETVDINVIKVWEDDDDKASLRPDEITVTLNCNGTKVGSITLNEENGWGKDFHIVGQPKATNGRTNEYTVAEVTVPGYSGKIETKVDEQTGNYTFTLTNTLVTPAEDDPPVLKKLTEESDEPETDEEFTFQLKGISKPDGVDEFPMPEDNKEGIVTGKVGEEKEFGILYFYIAGTYVYEISEKNDGKEGWTYDGTVYKVTYEVTQNGTKMESKRTVTVDGEEVDIAVFEFENEYKIPKVDIKVTKIWKDEQDAEHTRPESITVKLLANGEATDQTLTLSEENEWTDTFKELPLKKDGKEIEYTIEEIEIEYYDSAVTGDAETGFTITNTCNYVPTGDTANMTPWIVTMLLAVAGIGTLFIVRKRRED